MAKISEQSGVANIWLGSKQNARQTVLHIPAEAANDKPGLLFLEAVNNSATITDGLYLWADHSGNLHTSTSYCGDQDGAGTVFSASGATTELDNLGTTAINADLLDEGAGTMDIGSLTNYFKDFFFGGDLYCQTAGGGSFDVTLAFATPTADYTYTFPDAVANANVMLDIGTTNVINYAKGTSNIDLAAGGSIDIGTAGTLDITTGSLAIGTGAVAFNGAAAMDVATDKVVDIDQNLTVNTAACEINQNLKNDQNVTFGKVTATTTASVFKTGTTAGTLVLADAGITNAGGGIDFSAEDLVTTGTLGSGALTAAGITSSADVHLNADDVELQMGDASTDSYIRFNDPDMEFKDQTGTYTLLQLAQSPLDPTLSSGHDFTIPDGKITWTDLVAEIAGVWDFASTTQDVIDITADTLTSGSVIHIVADATTSSKLLHIQADHASTGAAHIYLDWLESGGHNDGTYITCFDGSGDVLTVKKDGAVAIAGNASGTDALTLTAGDVHVTAGHVELVLGNLALTNGNITNAKGILTVGNDADETNFFKRTIASGSTALLELEVTATDDAGNALFIDHKFTTGAATAVDIDSASTTPTAGVIDVDAAVTTGHVLDINMGTAVTSGTGIKVLSNSTDTGAAMLLELVQSNTQAAKTDKIISITQAGRGDGIYIDKDEGGNAINIDLDNAVDSQSIVALNVDVDNAGATAGDSTGLKLAAMTSSNGTSYGLYIADVTGSTNAYSIFTLGTGDVMINSDGDDVDVAVKSDDDATMFLIDGAEDTMGIGQACGTGSGAAKVGITVSNVSGVRDKTGLIVTQNGTTDNNDAVNIVNTGTGDALWINQDGEGLSLSIDSEATTANIIDIEPTALTTGYAISADDADALTTGGLLHLESDSVQTNARQLVKIVNQNALAIGAVGLLIDQDANSAAYALDIDADSNDAATVWAARITAVNATAAGGGIDFSGMAVDNPLFKFVDDSAGTASTIRKQIAVDIGGTIYYLYAYDHTT